MKQSEFPEKIFEILIDHVFLNKGLDIYVPSQNKEAKLGYDALFQKGKIKVGFFQYKIVNEYKRKPRCHSNATKVFKFSLHFSKSHGYRQHNLLVKKALKGFNCGYYVPAFIEYDTLYKTYHQGLLNKYPNSFLIISIDRIDDADYHYITFDNLGNAYQHSKEEKRIKTQSIDDFSEAIKKNDFSFNKEELTTEILSTFEEDDTKENREELAIKLLYECGICLVTYKEVDSGEQFLHLS